MSQKIVHCLRLTVVTRIHSQIRNGVSQDGEYLWAIKRKQDTRCIGLSRISNSIKFCHIFVGYGTYLIHVYSTSFNHTQESSLAYMKGKIFLFHENYCNFQVCPTSIILCNSVQLAISWLKLFLFSFNVLDQTSQGQSCAVLFTGHFCFPKS